ncbi:hypothetical protein J6590_041418, partial [Homalodisca vitripennis]
KVTGTSYIVTENSSWPCALINLLGNLCNFITSSCTVPRQDTHFDSNSYNKTSSRRNNSNMTGTSYIVTENSSWPCALIHLLGNLCNFITSSCTVPRQDTHFDSNSYNKTSSRRNNSNMTGTSYIVTENSSWPCALINLLGNFCNFITSSCTVPRKDTHFDSNSYNKTSSRRNNSNVTGTSYIVTETSSWPCALINLLGNLCKVYHLL